MSSSTELAEALTIMSNWELNQTKGKHITRISKKEYMSMSSEHPAYRYCQIKYD